jgi:hypothetical protein
VPLLIARVSQARRELATLSVLPQTSLSDDFEIAVSSRF